MIRTIPRPSAALLAGLARHGSATVHEALGRIGAMDSAVKPLARGMKICGPANTVQSHAADNLMV
jgi:4-hydroxy-4-methyl-2-oxoglutarate aldolase